MTIELSDMCGATLVELGGWVTVCVLDPDHFPLEHQYEKLQVLEIDE